MEIQRFFFRLLQRKQKKVYLKRTSKIVIARAFRKLDRYDVMGENLPYIGFKQQPRQGV